MTAFTDYDLLAHSLEIRLFLALIIVPVSYAAIQAVSFIVRSAGSLLAKFNSFGANHVAAGTYSAAGAR